MSGTTSVTAGGFTLNGFKTSSFDTGGYNSAITSSGAFLVTPGQVDSYDFNAGPTQTVTASASSDSWTLMITFNSTNAGDYLSYGNNAGKNLFSLEGGFKPAPSFTISGSGASQLQTFIQGLDFTSGGNGTPAGITFNLVDTTLAPGAVPSGLNNATQTNFTSYLASACYVAGTRIATPSGECDIAALTIGALVATGSGVAAPIKWIGRRNHTAAQIAAYPHLRPVTILAGALADAMPHRDLTVSPMHAMFIDDVFVPAAALVNGVSILRSEALEPVSYIHIELAGHGVVFAEGAPAETFVDDDSRLLFDNADEYYDMYGAEAAPAAFSAPRVEHGHQLEAIRRRLALRAGLPVTTVGTGALVGHVERLDDGLLEGWVTENIAGGAPVELDILVDGEFTARILANRYRADLDRAGLAGGRCAFAVALPASVLSLAQVAVRRSTDGAAIAMPECAALAV